MRIALAAMAAALLALPAAANQLHSQRWMALASYEQMQKAIAGGADVEALHSRLSVTPLVIAAAEGNVGAVRALCAAGADPQRDDHPLRQTPLHLVTTPWAAEELFHCVGLVSVFDDRGGTPLHYTAINGRPAVAQTLIRFGADPNDTGGGTSNSPLYMAARHAPHPAVLQVLIEAGAGPALRARHDNLLPADMARKHNPKVRGHPVMARLEAGMTGASPTAQASPSTGCEGHFVQVSDRRMGNVAEKAQGERSRWPEIARLNGITAEAPHRVGQCLALP